MVNSFNNTRLTNTPIMQDGCTVRSVLKILRGYKIWLPDDCISAAVSKHLAANDNYTMQIKLSTIQLAYNSAQLKANPQATQYMTRPTPATVEAANTLAAIATLKPHFAVYASLRVRLCVMSCQPSSSVLYQGLTNVQAQQHC